MTSTFVRMFKVAQPGEAKRRCFALAALMICLFALSACNGETDSTQDNTANGNQATAGAALSPASGEATIYIDTVNKQVPSAKGPVVVNAQQTPQIMVNGWAVDKTAQSPAGGVVMIIDGNVEVPTTYGAERPDVAKFLNNPNYAKSSFVGWINVSTITKGQHILSFKVLTADKRGYYEPANKITLSIQ